MRLFSIVWLFLWKSLLINANHFNGGTIRWFPIDSYTNSSAVAITIIQSYYWSSSTITCTTDVPITSLGRSSQNSYINCMADCSSDGGYSAKRINILTDCVSASSSLSLIKSERSKNITLTADAHFYAAYVGSAWISLNYPAVSGLDWSIVVSVNMTKRSDGFINTPPTAEVVSPQYTIVNRTAEIKIHVSDENPGDVVRCRWSVYRPGYRRRRRASQTDENKSKREHPSNGHLRRKRAPRSCSDSECIRKCREDCPCICAGCLGTNCNGSKCTDNFQCRPITTGSTTIDTPGTLRSTSTFPARQAIDECGGICYPGSLPNDTTLNNCTLSFRGLVAKTWYAVAIQVRQTDQD